MDWRHAFFAYATNYLIDTDNAVILDVEASRAIRQAEVGASRAMIDRTARRFGITPRHLAADSAYGSAANLAWLVKKRQIEPHIPVFDKSNRTDGTFSRSDFVFDAERNHYTCPQGKLLVQFRRTFATPRSASSPEEDRDAVRSPQTHPAARSPQIARSVRRARRIPTRCNSPEPAEARKASSDASYLPRAGMTAPKKSAPTTGPILRQQIDHGLENGRARNKAATKSTISANNCRSSDLARLANAIRTDSAPTATIRDPGS